MPHSTSPRKLSGYDQTIPPEVDDASRQAKLRLHGESPSAVGRRRWLGRRTAVGVGIVTAVAAGAMGLFGYQHFHVRYQFSPVMQVQIEEVTTAQYPEDPAGRSMHYGQYNGRRLKLVQRDETHFDFIFEPTDEHTAKVALRNVNVSLMTPGVPDWCQGDDGLVRIALTDREWNRQQVWFDIDGGHIEVSGGDGFEEQRLYKAALAKNCLNAGLWEIILVVEEDGKKGMYYQGWFTFPMGHYRRLVERNTGLDYADHWHYLEHWFDPAGAVMNLGRLRSVQAERDVDARFDKNERLIVGGEQVRKKRTMNGPNLVTWGDVVGSRDVEFATFIPPGRYSVEHPWSNEYWRLAEFNKATIRDVVSPASKSRTLQELELVFSSTDGELQKLIVGGVDMAALPQLPIQQYPQGMYMPMGIGVPPFYQSYQELMKSDPQQSPYYSFLLDGENRWIDHHKSAIDGPVMHRDQHNPNLVHLYLLSYERHSLVAHFEITIAGDDVALRSEASEHAAQSR